MSATIHRRTFAARQAQTIYKCSGKNTRTLTVAAASETEARQIYRRWFPKNRIKDIVCAGGAL